MTDGDDMTAIEKQQWEQMAAFAELWEKALKEASEEVAQEWREES